MNKTDSLQYFDDIKISRQYFGARLIYFLLEASKAFKLFRNIMVIAIVSIFVFIWYIFLVLSQRLNIGSVLFCFIISELILLLSVIIFFRISFLLSSRFSMKLHVGMRDAALFFCPLICFSLGFFVSDIVVLFIFFFSELVLLAYYEKIVAGKKQHDLDIPRILNADEPIDAAFLNAKNLKKFNILGETRNAVLVEQDSLVEFRLNKKADEFTFALGLRETLDNCGKIAKIQVCLVDLRNKREVLFIKVFNPKSNYDERGWLDQRVKIDWTKIDFETHKFIVEAEEISEKKFSGCYFSEPRIINKNRKPKKIIFVVFDALRHDHVGCYGYSRNTTPHIDDFSDDGIIFRNAFVQGEWTLTSFMSFLTSLFPSSHGVYHPTLYQRLSEKNVTLPEILRKNGFVSKCYFTHKRLVSNFGFARGFDSHLFRQCDKENKIATSDDVLSHAIDTLSFHRDDDLFLMLHFFDTHQPCNPASPYTDLYDMTYAKEAVKDVRSFLLKNGASNFSERDVLNLIARCDAEVVRADKRFGQLIDYLKSTGQYEDALIIFTSDHGMPLNDHGNLTELKLLDEQVRVPLIIKFPESLIWKKLLKTDECFVNANIDVAPTILDVLNMDIPESLQGVSLLAVLQGAEKSCSKYAISESFFNNSYNVSIRDVNYRYNVSFPFDFCDFNEIKLDFSKEEIFKLGECGTEVAINNKEIDSVILNKYREIIKVHIQSSKKRKLSR
ncbi:MAG: sulfatase-like hydrolase/transferase [Candidatus Omnitrophica bacterium]|nr:sulfatase-like hydrolase/transferase [Candidatus Omnitrophota bacterium]